MPDTTVISWADFIAMYWDLLGNERRKSYLLDMKEGKAPPPIEHPGEEMEKHEQALLLRHMGDAIRYRREERGISQQDFAKMLGRSKSHLSQAEAGNKPFSVRDLLLIIKILRMRPDEIFLVADEV